MYYNYDIVKYLSYLYHFFIRQIKYIKNDYNINIKIYNKDTILV